MIKEVSGDILLTEAQAIAHSVAPMDKFNSGLALSLRKNYPGMYKDFRHYCKVYHPKPGTTWFWGGVGGARIVNLLTQEPPKGHNSHPGKATLSNINHAVKELVQVSQEKGFTSLAIPRIATGVGGLDWDEVKPVVYKHLKELDIPIFVYTTYEKGVKAKEFSK